MVDRGESSVAFADVADTLLQKTPLGQFLRPIGPLVQLCYQHIRLCINAVALKPQSSRPSSSHGPQNAPHPAMQMSHAEEACLGIAISAAVMVIRLHREAVPMPDVAFSFATDVSGPLQSRSHC